MKVLAIIIYLILGASTYITTIFTINYFLVDKTEVEREIREINPNILIWMTMWPLMLLVISVVIPLILIIVNIIDKIKKS